MPAKYSKEEYLARLDRKLVGAAVLLLNDNNEILIVKPDYRDDWLLPGGSVDRNESPLMCAIRETREEVGLDIPDMQFLSVYYGGKSDALKFLFYGGVLSNDQIERIRLQEDELEEYKFLPQEQALRLLSKSLQECIPPSVQALRSSIPVYIEEKK